MWKKCEVQNGVLVEVGVVEELPEVGISEFEDWVVVDGELQFVRGWKDDEGYVYVPLVCDDNVSEVIRRRARRLVEISGEVPVSEVVKSVRHLRTLKGKSYQCIRQLVISAVCTKDSGLAVISKDGRMYVIGREKLCRKTESLR